LNLAEIPSKIFILNLYEHALAHIVAQAAQRKMKKPTVGILSL